ncbi:MAG TPA: ABC transporter substrate-binding protein [Actinomycetota bacterium]|nr:ABC transporter substrate-binding protein [Actinomycetota bacterium]
MIQTDWFPEAEHAAAYQLAGVGGEIDKEKGIYRNEIDGTGVTLEIRSGGPFVGFQPDVALLYQDPEIDLAYADMDDAVQTWGQFPVKGIVSVMNKSPLMLMWDPATYQFQTFADIGKSDATVLYFEGSDSYIRYLVSKGWLREDQLDASYDGSPARFVAERKIVQQGFVTNEVYKYEHEIKEWMKPVDYFLIYDAGYEFYPQMYAATPQKLEEKRECFKLLVPMLQQAQVDYMRDPGPVNQELVKIVDTLDTFWTISLPLNEQAHRLMLELELVSNENNDTLGDYEMERVQRVLDQLKPIFEGLEGFDPNITPDDIVTNEFIDPSIGL